MPSSAFYPQALTRHQAPHMCSLVKETHSEVRLPECESKLQYSMNWMTLAMLLHLSSLQSLYKMRKTGRAWWDWRED